MAFFRRLRDYVDQIEKSIDANFAGNEKVTREEQKPPPPVEEEEASEAENLEIDAGSEDLKKKIEEIANELEEKNKEILVLQSVCDEFGDYGPAVLAEFDRRTPEMRAQKEDLAAREEKMKQEIEGLAVSDEDMAEAKANLEAAQKEVGELQSKVAELDDAIDALKSEEEDIDESKVRVSEEITRISEQEMKKANAEEAHIGQNKILTNKSIAGLQELIVELSTQCSEAERNTEESHRTEAKFEEEKGTLTARIAELKRQLREVDERNAKLSEEKRELKATAMRKLASAKMDEKANENKKLLQEKEHLARKIRERRLEQENEMREVNAMIFEAENQEKQLKKRESKAQESIQKSAEEIQRQADATKSQYEVSQSVSKMASERLVKLVAEIDVKLKSISGEINTVQAQCDKLAEQKEDLNKEFDEAMSASQKMQDEVSKLSAELGAQRAESFDLENQLSSLKLELSSIESQLQSTSRRKKEIAMANRQEMAELETTLKDLAQKEARFKQPSLYVQWKDLARKCSEIEQEYTTKKAALANYKMLQVVFEETQTMLTEKQEEIERLRKIIKREKDFFQQKVAELTS